MSERFKTNIIDLEGKVINQYFPTRPMKLSPGQVLRQAIRLCNAAENLAEGGSPDLKDLMRTKSLRTIFITAPLVDQADTTRMDKGTLEEKVIEIFSRRRQEWNTPKALIVIEK